jgi:hypothetical protein
MVRENSQIIQAFPVTPGTYIGIADNYKAASKVLHVVEDCDLTFDFGAQGSVFLTAAAGQDFALAPELKSITSTGVVWIS